MNRVELQEALGDPVRSVVEICVQGQPFALDGVRTSVEFRLASRRGFQWDLVVLRSEDGGTIGRHPREVIMVGELESAVRDARVSLPGISRCGGCGHAATALPTTAVGRVLAGYRVSSKHRPFGRRHSLPSKLLDDAAIEPALDSRETPDEDRIEGWHNSADTPNDVVSASDVRESETSQARKMRVYRALVAVIARCPRVPTVVIYDILRSDWSAEWGPMPSYRSMCQVRRLMESGPASFRTIGREIVR